MGAPRWEHLHRAGPAGPALRHRLRCGQGRGECGCLPPPTAPPPSASHSSRRRTCSRRGCILLRILLPIRFWTFKVDRSMKGLVCSSMIPMARLRRSGILFLFRRGQVAKGRSADRIIEAYSPQVGARFAIVYSSTPILAVVRPLCIKMGMQIASTAAYLWELLSKRRSSFLVPIVGE